MNSEMNNNNNNNTEMETMTNSNSSVVPGGEEMEMQMMKSEDKMTSTTSSEVETFHTGVKKQVIKLMYWDDQVQSAVTLTGGSLFYTITHVLEYPMLSLGAWVLIVFVAISAVAKSATVVMDRLGMTPHPMLARLQAGLPSPLLHEDAVMARCKEAFAMVNMVADHWNEVLAFSDMQLTGKTVAGLYLVVRLFQVVSLSTLLFMTFFVGMTAPKVYADNKEVIDETVMASLEHAKVKGEELKAVAMVKGEEFKTIAMTKGEEFKTVAMTKGSELKEMLMPYTDMATYQNLLSKFNKPKSD